MMLISKSTISFDVGLCSALRANLGDEDWRNRASAAYALGKLGDMDAVQPVLNLLAKEANADVAIALCDCLGRLKDPRALLVLDQILLGRLKNEAQEVLVAQALIAYVAIDKQQSFDRLIRALNHPSSGVRATAVCALGELKDDRAIDPLILRLEDPTTWVRRRAALALVAFRSERAVEPILANLELLQLDDDPNESLFNNRYFSVDSEEFHQSVDSLPFTDEQRKRWTNFWKQ